MTNNNDSRGLGSFVAYQRAVTAVTRVATASAGWRGWSDLANQARRASVSVVLNLGEGSGHPRGSAERKRFWRIAFASALEVEAALDCAGALGLGDAHEAASARAAAGEIARMLTTLCRW